MKETITVFTGEVKTSNQTAVLKSSPIGSCVVVVLFDENCKHGGMAHIMLPDKAPEKENTVTGRYAQNAICQLIDELTAHGVNTKKLNAVVVGGGNVLKRENDTICINNLKSVSQLLEKNKIEVVAGSVKGTERKSVRFDIQNGLIFYTCGDGREELLYQIIRNPQLIDSNHETEYSEKSE